MYWQTVNLAVVTAVICLLTACVTAPRVLPVAGNQGAPVTYRVVRGDTLYSIAFRYDLDYRKVAEWNRLDNPNLIYAGQELQLAPPGVGGQFVTTAARPAPAFEPTPPAQSRPVAAASTAKPAPPVPAIKPTAPARPRRPDPQQSVQVAAAAKPPSSAKSQSAAGSSASRTGAGLAWAWPTSGSVVSSYQPNIPGRKGIQIGGRLGQSVRAASPGQVVYSGSGLPGYGRLIIVKHSETLLSAYGYLGEILVKEGDTVKRGQTIAKLGVGNDNRPVLHFEIRQNGKPVNPLTYLPS